MTFAQLRTFALVAELGSLRAAATALGVSEPAVSAAVAALRADLGDPLFRRSGSGISLTPGGRALATRARELVRLADRTRREVAHASTAGRLRVLATAACAEHVAEPVLSAFTRRTRRTGVDLAVGSAGCAATALPEDVADIVLGVRPAEAPGHPLESVPFLRYQRVAVVAPGHHLAGRPGLQRDDICGLRWLAGPGDVEPGSAEERWLGGTPTEEFATENEALDAVRAGSGAMLALGHAVRDDLRRGTLVRLPVEGTPLAGMWWATVPGAGRATSAARALQRFLTTPDATTALLARPARRSAPTVRVELWS
jgi:DNA-binding transcriptional LysR family regulator